MCINGETVSVNVKIPADLSAEGVSIWKYKKIDKCIADLTQALQAGGIDMRGCCCGHGQTFGDIYLQDGRALLILNKQQAAEWLCASGNAERKSFLIKHLNDDQFPLK